MFRSGEEASIIDENYADMFILTKRMGYQFFNQKNQNIFLLKFSRITKMTFKVCLACLKGLGWVLPYLGMAGRFCGDDPRFWNFESDWVPILYLNTI